MLHQLQKWSDAFQRILAPELTRLPELGERLKLCQRAWRKVVGPVDMLLQWVYMFLTAMLCLAAKEFLPPYFSHGSWFQYVAAIVASAVVFGPSVWLLRHRYRRNVRLELCRIGVAICVKCGYDLTGNTSGICPECGTPIPDDLKKRLSSEKPEPSTGQPKK